MVTELLWMRVMRERRVRRGRKAVDYASSTTREVGVEGLESGKDGYSETAGATSNPSIDIQGLYYQLARKAALQLICSIIIIIGGVDREASKLTRVHKPVAYIAESLRARFSPSEARSAEASGGHGKSVGQARLGARRCLALGRQVGLRKWLVGRLSSGEGCGAWLGPTCQDNCIQNLSLPVSPIRSLWVPAWGAVLRWRYLGHTGWWKRLVESGPRT